MRQDIVYGATLLIVTSIPHDQDPMFYIGATMAVILGMVLRIGIDIKNRVFSKNSLLIQGLVTFPICFFAYYLWIEYELTFKIQNYLFCVSFFAVFAASLIDSIGKIGIRQYARYLLSKVLAETKEKEDGQI